METKDLIGIGGGINGTGIAASAGRGRTVRITVGSAGFDADSVLKPEIVHCFEYSDCWVDNARLVVLNAQEVVARGGDVKTRTQVTRDWRENGLWHVEARNSLTSKSHLW